MKQTKAVNHLLSFFNDTKKRIESLLFKMKHHLKTKANNIIN